MASRTAIETKQSPQTNQLARKARREFVLGLASAVAATVIAALQPVITRYGAQRIDPLLFCTGSVTVAAVAVSGLLTYTGEIRLLFAPDYWLRFFALSLAGTFATSLMLVYGFERIDAVAGVILLESEPVYSLLLASLFLEERPSKVQVIATAIILLGIASVLGAGRAYTPLYAAALIFLTPLCWQTSHVLSLGVMPPLTPLCITGARYIYAAMMLLVVLLAGDPHAVLQIANPSVAAVLLFTGILVFLLGSLTWYGAISRLSLAWTTALVIPGVPIISFLAAMLFLHEHPSLREVIGIVIAVSGVLMLVFGAEGRRQSSSELAERLHQPIA